MSDIAFSNVTVDPITGEAIELSLSAIDGAPIAQTVQPRSWYDDDRYDDDDDWDDRYDDDDKSIASVINSSQPSPTSGIITGTFVGLWDDGDDFILDANGTQYIVDTRSTAARNFNFSPGETLEVRVDEFDGREIDSSSITRVAAATPGTPTTTPESTLNEFDNDRDDDDRDDNSPSSSDQIGRQRTARTYEEATIAETIVGTNRSESINGDDRNETSIGLAGRDNINGGGGDDWLFGNADEDTIDGGVGNDMLFGGRDEDLMEGGDGDDWMFGNLDEDRMNGGAGNDILFGGQDEDTMNGGDGDDVLIGDRDEDVLTGGAGADTFVLQRDPEEMFDDDDDFDELDDDFDLITDFQAGVDRLGLTGEFAVSDLRWEDGLGIHAGRTVIRFVPTGEAIAMLDNFSAANLNADSFTLWSL